MSKMTQNDTSVVGNNDTTTDAFKSRKYVITINNYSDTQLSNLRDFCVKKCSWYIFGKEVGEQGTPHIQGYLEFNNAKKRSTIKKAIGGEFYCGGARGSWKQNLDYCRKDMHFETNFEVYDGPQISLYDWQQEIVDLIDREPDDRTIHWVHERRGCRGKTTLMKWIHKNRDGVVILSGRALDMKHAIVTYLETNRRHPRVILINIPRSVERISYTGIEEIKDMCFFSGKYEGGMINGPSPHVVVFSNQEPDYGEMSEDRWEIKNLNISNEY